MASARRTTRAARAPTLDAMPDYQRVTDQLARGVAPEELCATCPWSRPCVSPPEVSQAEFDAAVKTAADEGRAVMPGSGPAPGPARRDSKEIMAATMITVLAYGPRVTHGELCPVLRIRLAGMDGRAVSDSIREVMRGFHARPAATKPQ